MAPPFANRYKKGQVKTTKDCWTCRKSTFTCLSAPKTIYVARLKLTSRHPVEVTDDYATTGDFFYTCDNHLKDRNFASALDEPAAAAKAEPDSSVSQEEIDAIIDEYKAKKDKKDKSADSKPDEQEKKPKEKPKAALDKAETPAPEPTHFQLHKTFFDMRLRLHNQKKMYKDAQARKSTLDLPPTPVMDSPEPNLPKAYLGQGNQPSWCRR